MGIRSQVGYSWGLDGAAVGRRITGRAQSHPHGAYEQGLIVSRSVPMGKRLASGSQDDTVRLWDAEPQGSTTPHSRGIRAGSLVLRSVPMGVHACQWEFRRYSAAVGREYR